MARLFGTDGVRGVANEELTPLLAMQLGQAGATVLTKENEHRPTIMAVSYTHLICIPACKYAVKRCIL